MTAVLDGEWLITSENRRPEYALAFLDRIFAQAEEETSREDEHKGGDQV